MSLSYPSEAVIWHDAENGAYAADLPLWRDLAANATGPVLELGCGTGRVALDLAGAGHEVHGVDASPALVRAMVERATKNELRATATAGDIREALPGGPFGLIAAPMQVFQLLAGPDDRARALRAAHDVLAPDGILAIAIAEDIPSFSPGDGFEQPLPDVAEVDGCVYSSLPLAVEATPASARIVRLRQRVNPAGELTDEVSEDRLAVLSATGIEREASVCGLLPNGRREITPTHDHLGSTLVLLERDSS